MKTVLLRGGPRHGEVAHSEVDPNQLHTLLLSDEHFAVGQYYVTGPAPAESQADYVAGWVPAESRYMTERADRPSEFRE